MELFVGLGSIEIVGMGVLKSRHATSFIVDVDRIDEIGKIYLKLNFVLDI